jgi:2',3'-cyclic-nucleotide 2'-phosphodiesterase (5'-nucleotidase family)
LNYLKKKLKLHYKSLILLLIITSCGVTKQSYIQPTSNINISASLADDEAVSSIIEPYKKGMSKAMDEVIGFCPAFLEKKKPSSILGSFMAEATFQAAKATGERVDFCLLNYGGIRSTLDSGDITIGEVFQIMPFENEITILTLSKRQMDTLFNVMAKKGGEPFTNHLWKDQTTYNSMNSTSFRLVTNDYMANGGDNYTILTEALERVDTGIKIRDGLITYIKANNPLPLIYKPATN